jgi:hypothetical protein
LSFPHALLIARYDIRTSSVLLSAPQFRSLELLAATAAARSSVHFIAHNCSTFIFAAEVNPALGDHVISFFITLL